MQQLIKQKDDKTTAKPPTINEKINGSSKKDETESKERDKSTKYRLSDTKPSSPLDAVVMVMPTKVTTPTDTKKSHDKDERKHKHKKKDKNKDKEKDKDRKKSKTKDIPNASPLSTSSKRKHSNPSTPTTQTNRAKPNTVPSSIPPTNQLSDKSSSESDDGMDYIERTSPKPDKVTSSNDTIQTIVDHSIEAIPDTVIPRSNHTNSPKKQPDKLSGKRIKEPKSNQSSASSKEEKKKKRKTKTEKQQKHDESGVGGVGGGGAAAAKRKTQSPIVADEPPTKLYKKDDDKIPKIKDENMLESNRLFPGLTPPVSQLTASPATQKLYHQSPDSSKLVKRSADSVQPKIPKRSPPPPPTSSSTASSSDDCDATPRPQPPPPTPPPSMSQSQSPGEKQYIAQLKALQHKIMTLQDNEELQQVVEMIAATGHYEVTNRTFDFDLCALDRSTVQRLQERLG